MMSRRGQLHLNPRPGRRTPSHQQNHEIVILHYNNNSSSSEARSRAYSISSTRTSKFCRFCSMTKIWSFGVVVAVSLIVLLVILGESEGQKSTRGGSTSGKASASKKRKSNPPTPTPRAPTLPDTSTIPLYPSQEAPPTFIQTITPLTDGRQLFPSDTKNQAQVINPREEEDRRNIYPSLQHIGPPSSIGAGIGRQTRVESSAGGSCAICERENCPPAANCALGHVMDSCSCCYICAVGDGARCFNVSGTPKLPETGRGICGSGLLCLERLDLEPGEPAEALCECLNPRRVCGSDNVTYTSECKLRETVFTKPNLVISAYHPCIAAPWVTTHMENVTGIIGSDVSVSCEFRAHPSAVIHWEFTPDGSSERRILPGDDSSIIQTNRGGPEEMTITSWIQIIAVTPVRQGVYCCVAQNSEGTARSYGLISVYR